MRMSQIRAQTHQKKAKDAVCLATATTGNTFNNNYLSVDNSFNC